MPRAPLLRIQARRGDLALQLLGRVADLAEIPATEPLRERVDLLGRIAEGLAHLARRGAVAIRDDVGRHSRAVRAVLLIDVLDDALALVSRRQVQVDVGPFAALLGEEPFEEQLHLHRIDRRDRQGVAHGAVGGRSPALDQDPVLEAEAHDVVDDQKVAGEIELLDHRELLLDLRLRLRRQRAKAGAGAVPGDLAQVRGGRLPGRKRVSGKPVPEIREREVEPLRELHGGGKRFGQIGEELHHGGGAPEVALALRGQEAPRRIERRVPADARQDVVELLVLRAGVAHAIRREQRQPQPPRQIDERLVAVLLLAQVVPFELDVQSAREEAGQGLQERPRGVEPSLCQSPRDRPLLASGQAIQPIGVRGDLLEGDKRLTLGATQGSSGQETAEVLVASSVFDEEGETGVGNRKSEIGNRTRAAQLDSRFPIPDSRNRHFRPD